MRKTEYDFLAWTSFPSSIKLINDEAPTWATHKLFDYLSVKPNSTLSVEVKAKQKDVIEPLGRITHITFYDLTKTPPKYINALSIPYGTYDWKDFTAKIAIPSDVQTLHARIALQNGQPGKPGIAWFDDLKICQDGVLIYSNDFAKWDPVIGAGIGAGVLGAVVPAVVRVPEPGVAYEYQKPMLEKEPLWAAGLAGLGALVGGGVGLLTALGIIPVPQIPPLPALEEPQEGARLGTYVVRG